uniref:Protein kinase domain-containing protein n=1 Tax=Lactuca sativa TaxID=4236 RepID=A0A9R1XUG4_LACSA|nr:hypothetical protein LSAT_V11C100035310 [Lactuca sativa]
MSSSAVNLQKYQIRLADIHRATNYFDKEYQIGDGGYGIVYLGQLSIGSEERSVAIKRLSKCGHQGSDEFHKELEMVPTFDHQNIISFIGYCEEANEMIIIYEYAANGSLDSHIQDPVKRHRITWAQRLKICLGAAKGLGYLHSAIGENTRVIHRDMKSANILLDENLEAKICDFGLSRYGPRNQQQTKLVTKAAGTNFYIDPVYVQRGRVSKESDVYSFGVVLFEMSSGMLCYNPMHFKDAKEQYLLDLVRCYYDEHEEDGLNKLIDPIVKGHIDMESFQIFNEIAHECINLDVTKRPSTERIIDRIQEALTIHIQSSQCQTPISSLEVHLKNYLIPLEEINHATDNFSENKRIRHGGYGDIYRGQLSKCWQYRTAAIKRLHHDGYLGEGEFHNELEVLSKFHHKNIISLIGYCDQDDEKILIYEYAMYGSLDHHLEDPNKMRCITWTQRLQICIGAARGLNYLHTGLRDYNGVIHRDVKSANVLLDGNLVAKITDFGLLRSSPKNRLYTEAKVTGTQIYLDPTYNASGILRKESNVYSFGMVMFEVLSKRSVSDDELIDPHIRNQIDNRSFDTFNEIAYQCTHLNFMERPTMDKVVDRIVEALDIQMEENVAVLCECVRVEVGFNYGKPVAAYTIYKCLLHWKTLEDERTPVFDKLIYIILSAYEDGENNNQMAYWISIASTLLFLIEESQKKLPPRCLAMGSGPSVFSGDLTEDEDTTEIVQQVEAKYPALLFKKRLIAYVEKMYDNILGNVKKELGSLLALCIQAPPRSEKVLIFGVSFGKDSHFKSVNSLHSRLKKKFGKDSHFNHWQGIVDCLNTLLNTLKENFVCALSMASCLFY